MIIIINIFFLIGIVMALGIYLLEPYKTDASNMYLLGLLSISVISILLNTMILSKSKEKANKYMALSIVLVLAMYVGLFAYGSSMDLEGNIDAYLNKDKVDIVDIERLTINSIFEVYKDDSIFVTLSVKDKTITINTNNEGSIRKYLYTLEEITDNNEIEQYVNRHLELKINNKFDISLIGVYSFEVQNDSTISPAIKVQDKYYHIEGNEVIKEEVFTKLLKSNTLINNKLFEIKGNVTDKDTLKTSYGVIETYYTDEEGKLITNGSRLYGRTYICLDASQKEALDRAEEYTAFLEEKEIKNQFIVKELKVQSNKIDKVNFYYYNNLDNLVYMEIMPTGAENSLFIIEKGSKFAYKNIESNGNDIIESKGIYNK